MFFTLTIVFWLWVVWNAYFYVTYRPRKVAGDKVLITGGASGIGRLMAFRFAKLGAKVFLWDLNSAALDTTKADILAAVPGAEVTTFVVDVTARDVVYRTARTMGDIDILINNAGIVTGKKFLDCPDALMAKTVEVNTTSHFWTLKAFLPGMIKSNRGNVCTIASAAGLTGAPGLVDYCASKFGAVGTHEALYLELRKQKSKVRATLVCPFYINTGMFAGVKSKVPFLLPILDENYVADRIILAIRRGEEQLNMPGLVNLAAPLKLLPVPWTAKIADRLGVTDSMDEFRGRGTQ